MTERNETYSRPAAHFEDDGTLAVRASAVKGCRRMLWYHATGHEATEPPSDEVLTVMEAGTALEPVVLRAMERASWDVIPTDPQDPKPVSLWLYENLKVTGHPDATAVLPFFGGPEVIVEVKTRGPSAYRRWQTLGAERSHPESVAQLAVYTHASYGEARDGVIVTMDTGSRQWDYEIIPAERVERALGEVNGWIWELHAHYRRYGADPETLPKRDFSADSCQCRSCPFLSACLPGDAAIPATDATEDPEDRVTREEAQGAVKAYTEAQEALREPEQAKRQALATLKAWMQQQGLGKTTIEERKVALVQSTRYSVDYRKLNATLDPEVRADIVTENDSEYVRVS